MTTRLIAAAVVGATLSVAFVPGVLDWFRSGQHSSSSSSSPDSVWDETDLERLPLAASTLSSRRTPFIVSPHPTARWTSDSRDLVCGAVDTLSRVCVCRKPAPATTCDMFYVAGKAPVLREANVSLIQPFTVEDMDCNAFYDTVHQPVSSAVVKEEVESGGSNSSTHTFAYFSRPVRDVSEDLWPTVSSLITPDIATMSPRVNLWLGSAGTTARLHYDSSGNLFTQISGRKRFLLVSPLYFHKLYLYSRQHPGHRQAQLDPDADLEFLAAHFPKFKRKYVQEVVLEPGMTLYIPPFYFHQVTALEPSVAANLYLHTDAKQNLQLLESVFPHLPDKVPGLAFDRQLQYLCITLRLFLADVIKGVHNNLHAAMVASAKSTGTTSTRTSTRTRPVAGSVNRFVQNIVKERHSHQSIDALVDWRDADVDTHSDLVLCPPDATRTGIDNDERVRDAVGLLSTLPLDSQEMLLADWVESRATSALNSTLARAFFKQCFPL